MAYEIESFSEYTSVTVTTAHPLLAGWKRGQHYQFNDDEPKRITRISASTFTVRAIHHRRWIESLHCAWERFVAWPVRDEIERWK